MCRTCSGQGLFQREAAGVGSSSRCCSNSNSLPCVTYPRRDSSRCSHITGRRTTASEKNDVTTSCTSGNRSSRGNLSNSSNRNCSLDHPVIIQLKQVQGQNEGDQKEIQKGISSLVYYSTFLRSCLNKLQTTRDYEFMAKGKHLQHYDSK
jgi:hypothetical protein